MNIKLLQDIGGYEPHPLWNDYRHGGLQEENDIKACPLWTCCTPDSFINSITYAEHYANEEASKEFACRDEEWY